MFEQIAQWIFNDWAVNFLDPKKRLFFGYLVSGFIIALCWLFFIKRQSIRACFETIFNRRVWLSASARADYWLFTLNTLILGVISPRLLQQTAVAYFLFSFLHEALGGRASLATEIDQWVIAVGFTVVLFVFDDFARYVVHRLMHRLPVLWAFHKVHHSATSLNPLTVLRTHPVESILFMVRSALVQGTCIALFVYCFADRVSLLMVLGANAFKFVFNLLGSNLRHSEIPIGYWRWLEKLLISPAQHQIHHSIDRKHHDKNFGVVLAIWDLLFNTHCHSEGDQKLQYGLSLYQQPPHRLKSLYLAPFRESAFLVWQHLLTVVRKIVRPVFNCKAIKILS